MPTEPAQITVITATNLRPDRVRWLVAGHEALHANQLTSWDHWIVLDGVRRCDVPQSLLDCDHVRVIEASEETASGAAQCRNIALFETTAPWVTTLDDDDFTVPGSLDVRLAAAQSTPGCGWVGGLLADGTHGDEISEVWDQPSSRGLLRAGQVLAEWDDPERVMFPYCSATFLYRTALARALGGWAALPREEDIMLSLAATSASDGFMVDELVYVYRRHEGQWTRSRATWRPETSTGCTHASEPPPSARYCTATPGVADLAAQPGGRRRYREAHLVDGRAPFLSGAGPETLLSPGSSMSTGCRQVYRSHT